MSSASLPQNLNKVGLTALAMAAARAKESQRSDRLFYDPFAEILAGPATATYSQYLQAHQQETPYLEIRTRFFDDFLMDTVRHNGVRQIVLLGAGMDARAYRLDWPQQTLLFEIEQPDVLRLKEETLSSIQMRPTCSRATVCLSLAKDDLDKELSSAGFRKNLPVVWLAEGLFCYLEEASVLKILDTISRISAPGSYFGTDFVNNDYLHSSWTKAWLDYMESFGAPWRFGTNTPETLLAQFGWEAKVTQPGEENANYGRWMWRVVPRMIANIPRFFFVEAQLR